MSIKSLYVLLECRGERERDEKGLRQTATPNTREQTFLPLLLASYKTRKDPGGEDARRRTIYFWSLTSKNLVAQDAVVSYISVLSLSPSFFLGSQGNRDGCRDFQGRETLELECVLLSITG